MFESLPQLAIQSNNNYRTGVLSNIGFVSMIFSIGITVMGLYRYAYWKFKMKVDIKDAPITIHLKIPVINIVIAKYSLRHSKSHYIRLFMKLMATSHDVDSIDAREMIKKYFGIFTGILNMASEDI